jgi:hypothetical protein
MGTLVSALATVLMIIGTIAILLLVLGFVAAFTVSNEYRRRGDIDGPNP